MGQKLEQLKFNFTSELLFPHSEGLIYSLLKQNKFTYKSVQFIARLTNKTNGIVTQVK